MRLERPISIKSNLCRITVYTDGSSTGKVGPGGWAFVAIDPDTNKELYRLSGGAAKTTNNRMELAGPIAALNVLPFRENVIIVSDSQLVVKGYNEWMHNWKKTNWRGNTVKNRDLWEALDKIVALRPSPTTFIWTRGHNVSEWNNIVDKLSVQARKSITERLEQRK